MARWAARSVGDSVATGVVGIVGLSLAILNPPFFQEAAWGGTARDIAMLLGFGSMMTSIVLLIQPFARAKAASSPTRAESSFLKHVEAPVITRAAPTPTKRAAAPRAAPDPLEAELQELSRAISRAGVLYGTGKLSGEGYALLSSQLKEARARLEVELAAKKRSAARN